MKNIIINTIWGVLEKLVIIGGGFFISIYVGKYLGPEKLGIITYSLSLVSIIIAISEFGANHTIFNRAIKNKKSAIRLLISTDKIRVLIYILFSFILVFFVIDTRFSGVDKIASIVIVLFSIPSGIDSFQYYYNGVLKSKVNSLSSQVSFVFLMFIRYFLVKYNFGFVLFSVAIVFQNILTYSIRWCVFKFFESEPEIISNKDKKKYIKYYLKTGLPLVATSLSIVIYTKINNIFISDILGDKYLGYFSVSQQLTNFWIFIPNIIIMSLLTKVLKDRRYVSSGISFITIIIVGLSLPIMIFYYYYSNEIVLYTFGKHFIPSSDVLFIMGLSATFSSLGFLNNRVLSYFGGYKFLLTKSIICAIVSVPLSYYMISLWGLKGAAISILFIEILSSTILNYFYSNLIFKSHIKLIDGLFYLKGNRNV